MIQALERFNTQSQFVFLVLSNIIPGNQKYLCGFKI